MFLASPQPLSSRRGAKTSTRTNFSHKSQQFHKSRFRQFPQNPFQSNKSRFYYSVLKLFTGFATAAFIAWKLTVSNAISKADKPVTMNIHQLIFVL